MTRRAPLLLVHVAGEPTPDHLQRCVPCGTVLTDNTGWWEGRVAVPTLGDDDPGPAGPSWWPSGALVATDKEIGSHRASITYVVESGTPLDDDEKPCVSP
jgi:hypothetical protein